MRSQVDSAIKVLVTPWDCAGIELTRGLVRWPAVVDLTLLAMAFEHMKPLATASLAGLTSLNVRQGNVYWKNGMPPLSSNIAATLRVIDITDCTNIRDIDTVRDCVQLRCLWMPHVFVQDLSPLAACSETLEELWLARIDSLRILAPLKACTRLRKLDLRQCYIKEGEVEGLQRTCTQLADPSLVELEGLVHELWPDSRPSGLLSRFLPWEDHTHFVTDTQAVVAESVAGRSVQMGGQDAVAAAGAIPALVQLLGPARYFSECESFVKKHAAWALCSLSQNHAQNQAAIAAAGVIPRLVQLLELEPDGYCDEDVLVAVTDALRSLVANHPQNQAAMADAGAIPALVNLLNPAEYIEHIQAAAACALCDLAASHAQNQAAIVSAGSAPALVQVLGPDAPPWAHCTATETGPPGAGLPPLSGGGAPRGALATTCHRRKTMPQWPQCLVAQQLYFDSWPPIIQSSPTSIMAFPAWLPLHV